MNSLSRNIKGFPGALLLCVLLVTAGSLSLSDTAYATQQGVAGKVGEMTVPFSRLRVKSGPIRLDGSRNEAMLVVPVSSREQISDLELALYVTNSISLTRRSQMAVSVNGSVIGQVAFSPEHPETRARIAVPRELIKPGYNRIKFTVAQHYTEKCEDPTAPELWSEIDTTRSHISYKVKPHAINPQLSELPLLMDKRLITNYTLVVATPGVPGNDLLMAGGFVSQAAALSREYAPVVIRNTLVTPVKPEANEKKHKTGIDALPEDTFGGNDGVLLGVRDQLKPWLDKSTYERAAQPLLALFPFGKNGDRFVLVVTGADAAQVRQAAEALVKAYATLPPVRMSNIAELAATTIKKRPTLLSGQTQAFSGFGFTTVTRQGIYPQSMNLRFWVPADRFARPNSELNLHLHMAYGAGFGPQATLNVFLNSNFEHAIHLTESKGAVYYDYRIPVPVSSLSPGWNELEFRPNMTPSRDTGACQAVYTDNLLLTLFDDSYLESDDMGRLAQLPDLSLFARTAFPFSGSGSNEPLTLALTGNARGNVGAAWSILAKLAQVSNAPLLNIDVAAPGEASGNVLLVGQASEVPGELLDVSMLNRDGWLELGTERTATTESTLLDLFAGKQANAAEKSMRVSLGDLMHRSVLVSEFESPLVSEKSVVMVLSDSSDELQRQVSAMIFGNTWGKLTSGTTVFSATGNTLYSYPSPDSYMVGSAGARARLSFSFDKHPAIAIGILVFGILLFSLLTWRFLVGYRRRHHQEHHA